FSGRGDLSAEEAPEMMRGLDHRAVARDIGHRGQRVELLGAREARHAVHREHGELPCGERAHELGVLRRPEETHERAAGPHALDFRRARRAHLEHDVGARPDVRDDLGAGRAVHVVGEVRGFAGAGLHRDPESQLDELFDDFGNCGDALLARRGLARHSNQLGHGFLFYRVASLRSMSSNSACTTSASSAAGSAPARSTVWSLSARPCEMRSPKPPAPMKAAMVTVPTLITAEVLIPAMMVGSASGSSTWRRIRGGVRPSAVPACTRPAGTCVSPAWVLRVMGSSAYRKSAISAGM